LAILQAVAVARTSKHNAFTNNKIQPTFNRNATQRKAEKLKTNSHQNGHQAQFRIFLNVYARICTTQIAVGGCLVAVLPAKPLQPEVLQLHCSECNCPPLEPYRDDGSL